jgi:hypothetical protein
MSNPKPLQDPNAERGLIGAFLLDPDTLLDAQVGALTRGDFSNELLGLTFDLAMGHLRAGRIPDYALLAGDLAEAGMTGAGSTLAGIVGANDGNLFNAPEFARRIRDLADRRRAKHTLEDAAAAVFNRNGDWREYVAAAGVTLATLDEAGLAENVTRPARRTQWTAAELLTTDFQKPPFVVAELLPAGLTMLGGRPKVGKSWLALQLVQAVSTGGMFLGQTVERGRCLYLALEDPPWRLAERMRAQGWTDTTAEVDFRTVGGLGPGHADDLPGLIRGGLYKLVVVDTLSRALAGDQNDGQAMTAALSPLQEAAHAARAAVVMVDHHNKIGAATSGAGDGEGLEPDVIVNLAGAISKGGIADSIWGLYRNKGKRGATLVVTGRDIEEQSLPLQQDPVTHVWQPLTDAGEVKQLSPARQEILQAITDLGGEAGFTEVVKSTGREKDSSNVYKRLQDLVNLGYLVYSGKRYALTQEEAE